MAIGALPHGTPPGLVVNLDATNGKPLCCQAHRFQTIKEGHTMNYKLTASFLVAGLLLLPVSGYTADTEKSTPTEFVKDSVITTKIKAELAAEKMSSLVKINVDTDKAGAVTLSGSAASQSAVDKAVTIAKSVKGVTSVKNHIKVVADK